MRSKIKYILLIVTFILLWFIVTNKSYATTWRNDSHTVPVTQKMTNAPYGNKDYCENKFYLSYDIEMVNKPSGSSASYSGQVGFSGRTWNV